MHIVRDGRDVVCSLLERGWLGAERAGADDAGLAYGAHARFWVEPERAEEFGAASEAKRAAWAWSRYVTAARAVPERTLELRYEDLRHEPEEGRRRAWRRTSTSKTEPLARSLSSAFDRSVGRWQRDLTPDQLEDVEEEAGELLQDLGYL